MRVSAERFTLFGFEGATEEKEAASRMKRKWPVGQVVKTEASHAFNIGSNPVRVTKDPLKKGLTSTKKCDRISEVKSYGF